MCNLSDYIEEKGIQKGIEQGIEQGLRQGLTALSSLVQQGIITAEKAAGEVGVTVEEFETMCQKLVKA